MTETISGRSEQHKAAIKYAELGFGVIPIHWIRDDGTCSCGQVDCSSPGKHPLTRFGSADATLDKRAIDNWWTRWPQANIAVATGEKWNLVVIDIDARDNGVEHWHEVISENGGIHALPDTVQAVTGGGGEHLFFRYPDGANIKNSANKIKPGIDVRGAGGYVLVEPSNHASGGVYEWEGSSDPLEGATLADMPGWLVRLVSSTWLASTQAPPNSNVFSFQANGPGEHVPADGSPVSIGERNVTLASLVGQWIHEGQARDELMAAATRWNSECTPPLSLKEVAHTVESVCNTHERNGNPAVPATREYVPEPPKEAIQAAESDDYDDGVPKYHLRWNVDLSRLPGALQQGVDYYNQITPTPQPEFAVAAMLSLASAVAGRRYHYDHQKLTLFQALIARSGAGKDTVLRAVRRILIEADLGDRIESGYHSRTGLHLSLSTGPSRILMIDEFGRALKRMQDDLNATAHDLVTSMMESFTDELVKPHVTVQQPRDMVETIHWPALSLLGVSTPEAFFQALSLRNSQDGALGRFLYFRSEQEPSDELRQRSRAVVPPDLVEWCHRASGPHPSAGRSDGDELEHASRAPTLTEVISTDGAIEVFRILLKDVRALQARLEPFGLDSIVTRGYELGARLAGLLAIAEDPVNPKITETLAKWASSYVMRSQNSLLTDIEEHGLGQSEITRVINKVREALARPAAEYGLTLRELKRNCVEFKNASAEVQHKVMEMLAKSGQVELMAGQNRQGGGRKPANRYRLREGA